MMENLQGFVDSYVEEGKVYTISDVLSIFANEFKVFIELISISIPSIIVNI